MKSQRIQMIDSAVNCYRQATFLCLKILIILAEAFLVFRPSLCVHEDQPALRYSHSLEFMIIYGDGIT